MNTKNRTICFLGNVVSDQTQRWARHYSSLGYDVHVISLEPGSMEGVRVHVVNPPISFKPLGYLYAVPKVKKLIHQIQPSILHAHYVTSYGVIAALTGWHPLVITAYGCDVLRRPKQSFVFRRMVEFSLCRSDLVTSMANHMTKTLIEMGIPEQIIITLPWGVDTSLFNPVLRENSNDRYELICTRNFDQVYNIELIIQALPKVIARYPSLKCALVGDGPLRSKLRHLAHEIGVQSNIEWKGYLSQNDIANHLSSSKIFLTTSLSDGNNISLNEAMACGCFPIATDIPANREWIVDGENGYLVSASNPDELAERIICAIEDRELCIQAAELNWQIVKERANWKKSMGKMEECYIDLMDRA